MSNLVLTPPSSTAVPGPLIFLAGPIQGAFDWQSLAIKLIHEKRPDIVIANPRRDDMGEEFVYAAQVDWETAHLNSAARNGVILFWLAKESDHIEGRTYAQTTRFEIAEWKARCQVDSSIRLVIGIEDGFSGARYIRHRYSQDCPNVPIVSTLEDACDRVLRLL